MISVLQFEDTTVVSDSAFSSGLLTAMTGALRIGPVKLTRRHASKMLRQIVHRAEHVRCIRVYSSNMALQVGGDGVCECTNRLLAAFDVGVDGELGVEQLARFADRDLERDPVSSGGHSSRRDSVRAQPFVDSLSGISGRGSKRLDLEKN